MKTIWRISVLFTGVALLVLAVERTGSGRVVRELHAMSGGARDDSRAKPDPAAIAN